MPIVGEEPCRKGRRSKKPACRHRDRPAPSFPLGYFRPQAIRTLVDDHITRRADRTSHIWALLMLELWFRELIDSPKLALRT